MENFWQVACKPNFVEDDHSSRRRIAARAHSDLPAGFAHRAGTRMLACASNFPAYLVLLRVGFTLPPTLQPERCALTAPFHPYPRACARWRYLLCGTSRPGALTRRSRTLSGTLPCGVRTFLPRIALRRSGSDRPATCHSLWYRNPKRNYVRINVQV